MLFNTKVYLLALLVSFQFFLATKVLAFNDDQSLHITVISNQVRGPECCDSGSIKWFNTQLQELAKNKLPASFALRYDALDNDEYIKLIKKYPEYEYGILLEVTPKMAQSASVSYRGEPARWYEAQNVFLVGYSPDERIKLIDAYFDLFYQKLGYYPSFTTSWMIDAFSLEYLSDKYQVQAHQITREQFGTDSYTLYGGPVHYPYYPSQNWPLIPDPTNTNLPLILRQTISDPVYNYADHTNSYTSQPNDYFIRNVGFSYFQHLFYQAHQQQNPYSFALVGLENTMPEEIQYAFFDQLSEIGQWTEKGGKTWTVSQFAQWHKEQSLPTILSYEGKSQSDNKEKAWWIETQHYRARIRQSQKKLYLSDLRIYDQSYTDPYMNKTAKKLGWWIVPFALDGSRFDHDNDPQKQIRNDDYKQVGQSLMLASNASDVRLENNGQDKKILINGNQELAYFLPDSIEFLTKISKEPIDYWNEKFELGLHWDQGKLLFTKAKPDLSILRVNYKSELFPEIAPAAIDASQTKLLVSNRYAIIGRNPSRLVFYPKNTEGQPVLLSDLTQIFINSELKKKIHEQDSVAGFVLIDLTSDQVGKYEATLSYDNFSQKENFYFAPNCPHQLKYCLTHPRHTSWYLLSIINDWWRNLDATFQIF